MMFQSNTKVEKEFDIYQNRAMIAPCASLIRLPSPASERLRATISRKAGLSHTEVGDLIYATMPIKRDLKIPEGLTEQQWLQNEYIKKERTIAQLAEDQNCSNFLICDRLKKAGIASRPMLVAYGIRWMRHFANPNYEILFWGKFWSQIKILGLNECWPWLGSKVLGYGHIFYHSKNWRSHRLAYKVMVGQVRDDVDVLHHCDNPPCCNPSHLFLGDQMLNNLDKEKKGRGNHVKGVDCPPAKICDRDVLEIRELRRRGIVGRKIAGRFGIAIRTVYSVARGDTWKHVK